MAPRSGVEGVAPTRAADEGEGDDAMSTAQIFVEGGWHTLEGLNAELAPDNLIAIHRHYLAAIVQAAGGTIVLTRDMLQSCDRLTLIQTEDPATGGYTLQVRRD